MFPTFPTFPTFQTLFFQTLFSLAVGRCEP
jgi:hypothetical protein